jgi:hypothetical protein
MPDQIPMTEREAEICTRELQRLYAPPIPKHEIPSNNPFITKTIVRKAIERKNHGFSQTQPAFLMEWSNYSSAKNAQKKVI